jgi:hypothetical protein
MPDTSPLIRPDDQSIQDVARSLAASTTPPDVAMNMLGSVNALLNACIGVSITLIVLAFLVFLFRWVIAEPESESHKIAIKGATRAAIATFLSVNIWFLIRAVDSVMALSNAAGYGIVLFSFVILTCWSFLSIGESFIVILSQATDWVLDTLTDGIRKIGGEYSSMQRISRTNLRMIIFAALIGVITFLGFYILNP